MATGLTMQAPLCGRSGGPMPVCAWVTAWGLQRTPSRLRKLALGRLLRTPEAGAVRINHGPNLGPMCSYSGTVSAAMEWHPLKGCGPWAVSSACFSGAIRAGRHPRPWDVRAHGGCRLARRACC